MEPQEQQNDVQQSHEPENVEQLNNTPVEENNDLTYFNGESTSVSSQGTEQATPTGQTNLLKAVMLAVAFGLIGCVAFGILYYIGYVAFIGAYLIFYMACLGYKKFNNGVIDKKGYTIVTLLSIVELSITIIFSVTLALMGALTDIGIEISFMDTLSYIPEYMELDPEFKSALISDIVVSVIFVFVGLISDLITTKKKAKINSAV